MPTSLCTSLTPCMAAATSCTAVSVRSLSASPVMKTTPSSAATRTFAERVRWSLVSAAQTLLLRRRSSKALRESSVGLEVVQPGDLRDCLHGAVDAHVIEVQDYIVERRVLPLDAVEEPAST